MTLPTVKSAFLRTKVARRTLLLFILSALLPVGALFGLGYLYVSEKLVGQSVDHLQETAKNSSVHLFERLQNLRTSFLILHDSLRGDEPMSIDLRSEQFVAVARLWEDDTYTTLWGNLSRRPPLGADTYTKIEQHDSIIVTEVGASGARVWLVAEQRDIPRSRALVAEINTAYLWSIQETLPYGFTMCVLDQAGSALFCSSDAAPYLRTAANLPGRTTSDATAWTYQVKLFLNQPFGIPAWTVLVSFEKEEALSDWRNFQGFVPALIVATLLLVILLSTIQIRRSMVPLDQLRNETTKIAAGQFDARVKLESGDEFEELADSFNSMARNLDRQFTTINTMAEIDRLILSSADRRDILKIVMELFPRVVPCDVIGLSIVNAGGEAAVAARNMDSGDMFECEQSEALQLPAKVDALSSHIRPHEVDSLPLWALPTRQAGGAHHFVFPITVADALFGVLAFGYREQDSFGRKELRHAGKLRDRLAVAFAEIRNKQELYLQSHYDPLTGLANRTLFEQRVNAALEEVRRSGGHLALMFMDLDRFKSINDSLGHNTGDLLIRELGARLAGMLTGPGQEIARISGDEFIIMVPGRQQRDKSLAAVAELAQRLLQKTHQPVAMENQQFRVSASIGIAVFPGDGRNYEELMRNADSAMYAAKDRGGHQFRFFSQQLHTSAVENFEIESELPRALENGQLELYYQPQFESHSQRLIGTEALMRWNHPERGLLQPNQFIPVATNSGIIMMLEEWAIGEVCRQMHLWRQAGLEDLRMSVNLSARQLLRGDLHEVIDSVLSSYDLDPTRLEVEVTEGSLVVDMERATTTLKQIRTLGVRVAVDDFGVGYSSLNYLRTLPLDTLKIDRSFIADIADDAHSAAITASIVRLAHSLGLMVVAEGVESEVQHEFLRETGCDLIQGFLLGKPVSAEAFFDKYASRNSLSVVATK